MLQPKPRKNKARKISKKNNRATVSRKAKKAGVSRKVANHRCGRGGGVPKKITSRK